MFSSDSCSIFIPISKPEMEKLLEPYHHNRLHFQNRIVRSAVYEGRCDHDGFPGESYVDFYRTLAQGRPGAIITGFAYVSREGRAMQPRQAGIDHPDKIPYFRKVTQQVHDAGCPIFLQIAHSGRQTLKSSTGTAPRGPSSRRSQYFRGNPEPLLTGEINRIIGEFANSAYYAREAGFDGIQLHAAHGYLIHQFLLPYVNTRKGDFGVDSNTGIGYAFLDRVIDAVREKCGNDFPVLVKISGGVDIGPGFSGSQFRELVGFLDRKAVDAIEISYGTMDHALNIFRGDVPESRILSVNPIFKSRNGLERFLLKFIMRRYYIPKLKPFTPAYNLNYAAIAKQLTRIPVISVGGFRNGQEMQEAITSGKTDLVGMARPFICETDLIHKLKMDDSYESLCSNCNVCSVMCDSLHETWCYKSKSNDYGTDKQNSFHHQPEC
jgi:2,4-dienoyl-CoA reductase-like NADH-dependent reductase (Old Yellow Enzyme family)